jgi:hypothetical protein
MMTKHELIQVLLDCRGLFPVLTRPRRIFNRHLLRVKSPTL